MISLSGKDNVPDLGFEVRDVVLVSVLRRKRSVFVWALYSLPALDEEILQNLPTFLFTYASRDLYSVKQPAVGGNVHQGAAGTCFGVSAAEDEPRNPCLDESAGAHRAWLERNVERAAAQVPDA